MFCMQCGFKLPDNAKFCMNCGAQVQVTNQEQNISGGAVSVEPQKSEITDVKSESTPKTFKPFFIPNASNLPVKLHTQQSLQVFSKYLDNDTYKFPLGGYEVSIPEYMITAINTGKYLGSYIIDSVLQKFVDDYKAKVHDANTFFKYGLQLMPDAIDRIADETQKFLIASGIFTVSENTVKELVKRDYENCQTIKAIRDFMALSQNIDGNTKQGQQRLNVALEEANIVGAMTYDLAAMAIDCMKFYQDTLMQENKNVSFTLPYAEEEIKRAHTIRDNTIKHTSDKEQVLANLSKSLTYIIPDAETLAFLTKYFARAKDDEILAQVKTIAEFSLQDNVYDKSIAEVEKEEQERKQQELNIKREALEPFFSLPEETSENVRQKIEVLTRESAKIGYDVQDKINELNALLREREAHEEELKREQEKQQREAKLNAAMAMPEDDVQQIKLKIDTVKREAEKINYDCTDYVVEINLRLKEAEEAEESERLGSIASEVMYEAAYLLGAFAIRKGVIKYFHGLVYGSEKDSDFMDKNLSKIYHTYSQVMDYPFKELPILYYDDRYANDGKVTTLITPFNFYTSEYDKARLTPLEDVDNFTVVEKFLSRTIKVDNDLEISALKLDKKDVQGFIDCLKYAVRIAKIMRGMFVEDSNGELTSASEEKLRAVLDVLRNEQVDKDGLQMFISHLYAVNGKDLLDHAPARFKEVIDSDKDSVKQFGTDEIIKAAHSVEIESPYFEVGNPTIESSSRKYFNAKRNLRIPDNEEIFLIFDATILGGVRKGFAFCTTGLYYCTSKPGYMDWNKFSKVPVIESTSGVKIGSEDFLCSDEKEMLKILTNLQERIKEKS